VKTEQNPIQPLPSSHIVSWGFPILSLVLALSLAIFSTSVHAAAPFKLEVVPTTLSHFQEGQGEEDEDQGPGPDDEEGPEPGQGNDGDGEEGPKAPEPLILDSPFEAWESACVTEQDSDACLRAGLAWKRGEGIDKPDNQQAAALFDAGCRFGSKDACLLVGRMYLEMETGLQFVMPKGTVSLDFGAAADSFQRACRLGSFQACGIWGDLYMNPRALLPRPEAVARNIKVDMIQAIQAWTQGCNEGKAPDVADIVAPGKPAQADERSCLRLAQLNEVGKAGVRKNLDRSALLYRRACYASGKSEHCETAEEVASGTHVIETEAKSSVSPRADAPTDNELLADTTSPERLSVQPHRPRPKVGRFTKDKTGLINSPRAKPIRFDIEFGLGARWLYARPSYASVKWRLGVNVWFGLLGFSFEGGLHTDSFLQPAKREYLRFMHSLSAKLALPLPLNAEKFHGELYLVLGGGATLGALELTQGSFMPTWGAREMIQLVAVTHAQRGPRQWGALRFEQQQSMHPMSEGTVEHSSQVILLFGFTFGGPGPSLPGAKVKREPWQHQPRPGDPNPEPGTSPL
jgi:TPR repeat protein